jgi:hypothetical protein
VEQSSEQESIRRRRGRPTIDDGEQILAHVRARLAAGLNISQAARGGLKIYGYKMLGSVPVFGLHRVISAATLERRYRELSGIAKAEIGRVTGSESRPKAVSIRINARFDPARLLPVAAPKRGRPKKIRR